MECPIRVSRVINGKRPLLPGYEEVYSLTKSTPYGDLSPYCLKSSTGIILENLWQFSKIYQQVPESTQTYSRYDSTVIWNHPSETHVTKDSSGKICITDEYYQWRQKGFDCKYAVRYPVGYHHRHKCLGVIHQGNKYNYIDSRKVLYLPAYLDAVKCTSNFKKLQTWIKDGKKLLITEVDGPHQESLNYYQQQYGVGSDFIQNHTTVATKENLDIMLNDPKHPFGHGYCLAWALLEYKI